MPILRVFSRSVYPVCHKLRSNTCMEHTSDTDKRLTELEIKVGFMEDLVDELNTIVVEQRQQIDLLVREVKALRMQAPNEATPVFHSLRDELPPHY